MLAILYMLSLSIVLPAVAPMCHIKQQNKNKSLFALNNHENKKGFIKNLQICEFLIIKTCRFASYSKNLFCFRDCLKQTNFYFVVLYDT